MLCPIIMAKRKPTKKEKLIQRMTLERVLGIRPPDYSGPLPRPKCNCNYTGCWGCMNHFKWTQKARLTKINNLCAEIMLPNTTRNTVCSLYTGEIDHIDRFRIVTRTPYANDTTSFRRISSS